MVGFVTDVFILFLGFVAQDPLKITRGHLRVLGDFSDKKEPKPVGRFVGEFDDFVGMGVVWLKSGVSQRPLLKLASESGQDHSEVMLVRRNLAVLKTTHPAHQTTQGVIPSQRDELGRLSGIYLYQSVVTQPLPPHGRKDRLVEQKEAVGDFHWVSILYLLS